MTMKEEEKKAPTPDQEAEEEATKVAQEAVMKEDQEVEEEIMEAPEAVMVVVVPIQKMSMSELELSE